MPSAVGAHAFEARAGHHLAPGLTSSGSEVFPELGAGVTLLAAPGADTSGFEAAISELEMPLTVVALDAASASRYVAPLVLVRPDEYVAWAGTPSVVDAARVLATAIGA